MVCSPHNFNCKVFKESMILVLKEICKEYSNKKRLEEIAKKSNPKEDKKLDLKSRLKTYETQIQKETRKLELLYEDRHISVPKWSKMSKRKRPQFSPISQYGNLSYKYFIILSPFFSVTLIYRFLSKHIHIVIKKSSILSMKMPMISAISIGFLYVLFHFKCDSISKFVL